MERDSWTLPSAFNHWHCCQITSYQTLDTYFATEEGSTCLLVHAKAEEIKIKMTRKRSSQHQVRLLPPKISDEEYFLPFLLPL